MVTLLAKLRADEKDGGEAEPSKESGTLTQAKGHIGHSVQTRVVAVEV